jgi:hypothetical protein
MDRNHSIQFIGEIGSVESSGERGRAVRAPRRGSTKVAFYIPAPQPNESLTEWFEGVFETLNAKYLELGPEDALGIELHAPENFVTKENYPYFFPVKLYSRFNIPEFLSFYEKISQSARFLTLASRLICIITVIRSDGAGS